MKQLIFDIAYRPFTDVDRPIVFSTWITSSWQQAKTSKLLTYRDYHAALSKGIDSLLARGAKILLAVDPDDQTTCYGWVCYEDFPNGDFCMHYVYTRLPFRSKKDERVGIASLLLRRAFPFFRKKPFSYTSQTVAMSRYLKSNWMAKYKPSLIGFDRGPHESEIQNVSPQGGDHGEQQDASIGSGG